MNTYPQDNSILILDNCAIHKSGNLKELVESQGWFLHLLAGELVQLIVIGSRLIYLPPYSPDFNPIEESFSCCMYNQRLLDLSTNQFYASKRMDPPQLEGLL